MKRDLALDKPADRTLLRATAKGVFGQIDREGGDYGAGLLTGVAVITRGEALGHDMWIDATMLQQVHDAINATGNAGIKARFTHPGLSSDGLGTFLGRFKNAVLDGDIVRADLHLARSAHDTPDGDLAAYVMDLAEEDPQAFGTSIVFRHDLDAEATHRTAHSKNGVFQSPDKDNQNNYPHARLRELRAVDAVDSPAANPGGLFHRQSQIVEAEQLAAYALGLDAERPAVSQLSIDPDRLAGFAQSFLKRRGLRLVSSEEHSEVTMHTANDPAQETKPNETQPAETRPNQSAASAGENKASAANHAQPAGAEDQRSQFTAELKRFTDRFGAENGTKWFTEGKSWEEALELHTQVLAAALEAKQKELTDLSQKLASVDRGEEEPVTFSEAPGEQAPVNERAKQFAHLGERRAKIAAGIKLPS